MPRVARGALSRLKSQSQISAATYLSGECRRTPSPCDRLPTVARFRYDRHQRELPWRQGTSVDGQPIAAPSAHGTTNNTRAYAVWVSEVMLQQTQVRTAQFPAWSPQLSLKSFRRSLRLFASTQSGCRNGPPLPLWPLHPWSR